MVLTGTNFESSSNFLCAAASCRHSQAGNGFPTPYGLEMHKQALHGDDVKIFCEVASCPQSIVDGGFPNREEVQNHMLQVHTSGTSQIECPFGGCLHVKKSFNNHDEFLAHFYEE